MSVVGYMFVGLCVSMCFGAFVCLGSFDDLFWCVGVYGFLYVCVYCARTSFCYLVCVWVCVC